MNTLLLQSLLGVMGMIAALVVYMLVMKYPDGEDKVKKIGDQIHNGALAFMKTEYKYLLIFIAVLVVLVWFALCIHSAIAVITGAACSSLAGFIGMYAATKANVRTATAAQEDGAAAALLMTAKNAERRGIEPLARIVSYATVGVDPKLMGIGPVYASKKALDMASWSVKDLDLIESNEAFAAQACAVNKEMGLDPAIVNVNCGAIAIWHPIGASGCRILNTLLFEMRRRDVKKGLATLCIGGGMGVAMCLERP